MCRRSGGQCGRLPLALLLATTAHVGALRAYCYADPERVAPGVRTPWAALSGSRQPCASNVGPIDDPQPCGRARTHASRGHGRASQARRLAQSGSRARPGRCSCGAAGDHDGATMGRTAPDGGGQFQWTTCVIVNLKRQNGQLRTPADGGHTVYTEGVGGSSPSSPTIPTHPPHSDARTIHLTL
jgi:hypothetical protein